MRRCLGILVASLSVVSLFGQDPDEFDGPMSSIFAQGNMALRQIQAEDHPVQQLKRFFNEAKLPLTSAQERQMHSVIEARSEAVRKAGKNEEAIRRVNEDYTGKFYGVLTSDQRLSLRRYRTDQIMLRGGFGSLKQLLDGANKSLTSEQETAARAVYEQFNNEVNKIALDPNGNPNRLQLDKAESDALAKVVKLLTQEQLQVLINSRQNSVNRLPR